MPRTSCSTPPQQGGLQREDLAAFYPTLLETLIHTVKPQDIAMFLGKKPQSMRGRYSGEATSLLGSVRDMGMRIKHRMGPASVKMYDKFSQVLRIETTKVAVRGRAARKWPF